MSTDPIVSQVNDCPRCGSPNPPAARFCAACGQGLTASGAVRGYAANPSESVTSLAVVSTVMPYAAARAPQTYKLALAAGLAVPVVALFLGALPFALVTAAFVVPVVYIVYLYDVNMWEDEPVRVVLAAFVLSAVLGLAFTALWASVFHGGDAVSLSRKADSFDVLALVIPGVVAPVIAVLLMLIGPVILASRPAFDDLMDGLTFGVVSGVAFAAAETLVLNWTLIKTGLDGQPDVLVWTSVILNIALLKPLVYGSAIGLAAGQFSGLGEGFDGFTGAFLARTAEAMAWIVAFQVGLYLTGLVQGPNGLLLGMFWALAVAAGVVLRLRVALQRALVEGAMEAAARESGSKWAAGLEEFCPECEMPLLENSLFCVVCGVSVRARSKVGRQVGQPRPAGGAEAGDRGDEGGERP